MTVDRSERSCVVDASELGREPIIALAQIPNDENFVLGDDDEVIPSSYDIARTQCEGVLRL
jgi:hypothetical protein